MIRLRNSAIQSTRMPPLLAPLLGVVFLLLAFYLMNLKYPASQSQFSRNLPIGRPLPAVSTHHRSEIKVGLRSDRHGNLKQLTLGSHELGSGDQAFARLNQEILKMIGRTGNPLTTDIEVEIDADFETQYKYIVQAVSECTGHYDPETKQVTRYVEKVKFAPPHKPKG